MIEGRLGKTPTQYAGIKPGDWNIHELLSKWSVKEKIEFMTYFERDTYVSGIVAGFFIGAIFGLLIGVFVVHNRF